MCVLDTRFHLSVESQMSCIDISKRRPAPGVCVVFQQNRSYFSRYLVKPVWLYADIVSTFNEPL